MQSRDGRLKWLFVLQIHRLQMFISIRSSPVTVYCSCIFWLHHQRYRYVFFLQRYLQHVVMSPGVITFVWDSPFCTKNSKVYASGTHNFLLQANLTPCCFVSMTCHIWFMFILVGHCHILIMWLGLGGYGV